MKKTTRIAALLAAAALIFGGLFFSCSGGDDDDDDNPPPPPQPTSVLYRFNTTPDNYNWSNEKTATNFGTEGSYLYYPAELDLANGTAEFSAVVECTAAPAGKIGIGIIDIKGTQIDSYAFATTCQSVRYSQGGSENGSGWTSSTFQDSKTCDANKKYIFKASIADGKITFEIFDENGTNVATKANSYNKWIANNGKAYFAIGTISGSTASVTFSSIKVKTDKEYIITEIKDNPDKSVMTLDTAKIEIEKDDTKAVTYTALDAQGSPAEIEISCEPEGLVAWIKTNSVITFTGKTTGTGTITVKNTANTARTAAIEITVIGFNDNDNYNALTVYPANKAPAAYEDGEMMLTFDDVPELNKGGTIKIYNIDGTQADSIAFEEEELTIFPQDKKYGKRKVGTQLVRIAGNSVFFTPHVGTLKAGGTYYIAIPDAAITGKIGGKDFQGLSNNAENTKWKFTIRSSIPAAAPEITVDGSRTSTANFRTIQAALRAIGSNSGSYEIKIADGIYRENLHYSGNASIKLSGASGDKSKVVVSFANGAKLNSEEKTRDLFEFAGADLVLEHITLENTYSRKDFPGDAQAEALGFDGSGTFAAYKCAFKSHQDTIRTINKAWFYECYIEGDTDFIWQETDTTGAAVALYENCEIVSLYDENASNHSSYICAPKTNSSTNSVGKGVVLYKPIIDASDSRQTTYLARTPWSSGCHNQVAVISPQIKGSLASEYWHKNSIDDIKSGNDIAVGWKSYGIAGDSRAISADMAEKEFAGRKNILNRVWNKTEQKFVKDTINYWDIGEVVSKNNWNVANDDSKDLLDSETEVKQTVYSFKTADGLTNGDLTISGFSYHSNSGSVHASSNATIKFSVSGNCYIDVSGFYKGSGTIQAGSQSPKNFACNNNNTSEEVTTRYTNYSGSQEVVITTIDETYLTKIIVAYDDSITEPNYTVSADAFEQQTVSLDLNGSKETTQTATAKVNGSENSGAVVTYASSKPSVATVDAATGKVTAVAIGQTRISAKASYEGVDSETVAYTVIVKDSADPSAAYTLDFRTGDLFDGTTYSNQMDFGVWSFYAGSKNAANYNGSQHGAQFKEGNALTLKLPANAKKITLHTCAYDNGKIQQQRNYSCSNRMYRVY